MTTANKVSQTQRIMFLYINTGGGHVSAAKALIKDLENRYTPEEVETHLVNGMGQTKSWSSVMIENGYTVVSSQLQLLWPAIYNLGSWPWVMSLQTNIMRIQQSDFLADYIIQNRITKVVVLHFLMIRPLYSALCRMGRTDMPAVTVVLDPFTIHNMWTFHQFMPIIAFSHQASLRLHNRLKKFAIKGSRAASDNPEIRIMPPILDKRFAHRRSEPENRKMRTELGLALDKPVILLAGGGEGLPDGERYLRALAHSRLDMQVVMVCGKNKIQYDLAGLITRLYPAMPIKVLGFVNIMYELMNLADIIVTKGGPATVFEALSLRKPMIVTKYLYGQEQGNVDYVVHHGLGWYERKPGNMVRRVQQLLENPSAFDAVRHRLSQVNLGIGTSDIADFIVKR